MVGVNVACMGVKVGKMMGVSMPRVGVGLNKNTGAENVRVGTILVGRGVMVAGAVSTRGEQAPMPIAIVKNIKKEKYFMA